MATGPFTTDRCRLGWGYTGGAGTITGGKFLPIRELPIVKAEVIDMTPGMRQVGVYMPGTSRKGARHFELPGVIYDLYPQADGTTRFPHYEILQAAGFAESGSFTYTLGDPHIDGDTPDGDLVLIAKSGDSKFFGYIIDTQLVEAQNICCNLGFNFIAGEVPQMVVDFYGQIPGSVANTTPSLYTVTPPSVTAQSVLPREWQTAGLTIGSIQSGAVVEACSINLNAQIEMARDGNSEHAIAAPRVSGYRPTFSMLVRAHNDSAISDQLTGTARTLSFVNGGTGTGGIITVTMSVKTTGVDVQEKDNFKWYMLSGEMNPSGSLSLAWT